MYDFKNTTELVKTILEEDVQSRNSDSFLYLKVLESISDREGFALCFMTVPYFLENMKDYGFPPFESVRRTRQKIQATYPELAATKKVIEVRKQNEQAVRVYALSELKGGSSDGRTQNVYKESDG